MTLQHREGETNEVRIRKFEQPIHELSQLPEDDSLRRLVVEDSIVSLKSAVSPGDIIAAYRHMAGLSLTAMMAEMDSPPTSSGELTKIERGSIGIPLSKIEDIANACGVHPAIMCLQIIKLRWLDTFTNPAVAEAAKQLEYEIDANFQ